ncbi:MAG: SDR family NAD(P)-dependent oxidoreductase, partial [Chthoniobacterales bacterium]
MNILKDKVALVTGATSGIGRETAILFAGEGAKVVVAGRRKEEGEEVAALIRKAGGTAKFIQADVSKADQVEQLINETVSTFGTLNVAFNNAG